MKGVDFLHSSPDWNHEEEKAVLEKFAKAMAIFGVNATVNVNIILISTIKAQRANTGGQGKIGTLDLWDVTIFQKLIPNDSPGPITKVLLKVPKWY
jgi:hypothetical protein